MEWGVEGRGGEGRGGEERGGEEKRGAFDNVYLYMYIQYYMKTLHLNMPST